MNVPGVLRMTAGLALAVGFASEAHAFSGCTNNSLFGSYGLQFDGAVTTARSQRRNPGSLVAGLHR
jgi:hypothetical protein